MSTGLISCIIPVFNGERFLAEALDSILAQTYRPLEIIVADDGSTDGTAEVAASYGDRVAYLRQAKMGAGQAKNMGLDAAQGEYIAFLDADDLWHPSKLTKQMARLKQRPEIDLCFTRYQNFWVPELAEEKRRYQEHPFAQPTSAWSLCTLVSHRSTFDMFGRFAEGIEGGYESTQWVLRAAGRGAVIEILSDVMMYRRIHQRNQSRELSFDDEFFVVLKAWRDYQRQRSDESQTGP
jgi:glycosyltransferase involved in cell wall biosynthesis